MILIEFFLAIITVQLGFAIRFLYLIYYWQMKDRQNDRKNR